MKPFTKVLLLLCSLYSVEASSEHTQNPHNFIQLAQARSAGKRAKAFTLEKVEIIGSERLSSAQLAESLHLLPGTVLDDAFVMTAREKLLSLGLFKSAILSMRKGSQHGRAILIVRLEDDPSVIGPWALGGMMKLTQGEIVVRNLDPATLPLGYTMELLSRNLFTAQYRGSITADIDALGELRAGRLTFGLPRFAEEDLQFDFNVSAVDVRYRYLEALGFGGKIYGNWTQTLGDYSGLEYGLAMYVNRSENFEVPEFPRSLAGPRIAWIYESRLLRFFPGEGSKAHFGLLYAPIDKKNSIGELSLAHTKSFADSSWLTVELDTLALGVNGYSARAEVRFDLSATDLHSHSDQVGLYFGVRGGRDKFASTDIEGAAALIGLRYHSEGFIAEISFQITQLPEELRRDELKDWRPR